MLYDRVVLTNQLQHVCLWVWAGCSLFLLYTPVCVTVCHSMMHSLISLSVYVQNDLISSLQHAHEYNLLLTCQKSRIALYYIFIPCCSTKGIKRTLLDWTLSGTWLHEYHCPSTDCTLNVAGLGTAVSCFNWCAFNAVGLGTAFFYFLFF